MMSNSPFIAANKFGLGMQPGELAEISPDPKGWLLAQLDTAHKVPARFQNLPTAAQAINRGDTEYQQRRAIQAQRESGSNTAASIRQSRVQARLLQQSYYNERLAVAAETDQPFAERLVRFWSNHFTVAALESEQLLVYAGVPYENEAIRGHMNGSFEDMLMAVMQQPAMLIYLDNVQSIGPNSTTGSRRGLGANENLAREVLELHTLGVNGAYTQSDVSSLALMLTGWTANLNQRNSGLLSPQFVPGGFLYLPQFHEPGSRQLLGKTYTDNGQGQAEQALRDIARHPSTAAFIAYKLARHFIADTPPESAIFELTQVFIQTRGNLAALHRKLVELDDAWDSSFRKLKSAEDFVVSTLRAFPQLPLTQEVLNQLTTIQSGFNQRPFSAPSPAGWPEAAEHWGGPDALLKRLEFVNQVGQVLGNGFDSVALSKQILPDDVDLQTAVSRAESRLQALTLLLGSPQFQWRA